MTVSLPQVPLILQFSRRGMSNLLQAYQTQAWELLCQPTQRPAQALPYSLHHISTYERFISRPSLLPSILSHVCPTRLSLQRCADIESTVVRDRRMIMKYLPLTRRPIPRKSALVVGQTVDPIRNHRLAAFQFFAGRRDAIKWQQRQQT